MEVDGKFVEYIWYEEKIKDLFYEWNNIDLVEELIDNFVVINMFYFFGVEIEGYVYGGCGCGEFEMVFFCKIRWVF